MFLVSELIEGQGAKLATIAFQPPCSYNAHVTLDQTKILLTQYSVSDRSQPDVSGSS